MNLRKIAEANAVVFPNGPVVVGSLEQWGFIPEFLRDSDPRPAWKQIDANYAHGGGWQPTSGFKIGEIDEVNGTARIRFPGDPEFRSLGCMIFRDELLFLFEASFVMAKGRSGDWEVARLD
jgi:hypothetical protein